MLFWLLSYYLGKNQPHWHLVCQKFDAKTINVEFQAVKKKSYPQVFTVHMDFLSGGAAAKPFKLLVQNLEFQDGTLN